MKNILDCCVISTPLNTTGMGDVNPISSGDVLVTDKPTSKKNKKKHKMKSLKKYIMEDATPVNGFCILKPEFTEYTDTWLTMLKNNNWNVIQKKEFTMDKSIAQDLYSPHKDKDFYNDLCDYMSSGNCVCCTCSKTCDDPIKDMEKIKDKVRKAWGKDDMKNAMHSSDSLDNVNRESKIIFS